MEQSAGAATLVSHIDDTEEIIAGDGCVLRELLHPERSPVAIGYSLAHAFVEPGGSTKEHYLSQSEVYYVIAGEATMYLDDAAHTVTAGSFYYIPPMCRQYLINHGPARFEFLCIVDPPWSAEGEIVEEN